MFVHGPIEAVRLPALDTSILGCYRGPVGSVVDKIDEGAWRVSDLDECFSSANASLLPLLHQEFKATMSLLN